MTLRFIVVGPFEKSFSRNVFSSGINLSTVCFLPIWMYEAATDDRQKAACGSHKSFAAC